MDGFTVATELIKRYEKSGRPMICALTANSDTKTREHCFEVGMDYVLMKPISLPLLKTELVKILELRDEFKEPPPLAELSHLAKSTSERSESYPKSRTFSRTFPSQS
jgi:CheY-like chemotaxis protein